MLYEVITLIDTLPPPFQIQVDNSLAIFTDEVPYPFANNFSQSISEHVRHFLISISDYGFSVSYEYTFGGCLYNVAVLFLTFPKFFFCFFSFGYISGND